MRNYPLIICCLLMWFLLMFTLYRTEKRVDSMNTVVMYPELRLTDKYNPDTCFVYMEGDTVFITQKPDFITEHSEITTDTGCGLPKQLTH